MKKHLITVASWEDRFLEGFRRNLNRHEVSSAVVFFVDAFEDRTLSARREAKQICSEMQIELSQCKLYSNDASRSWKESLVPAIGRLAEDCTAVVDVSTMPREVIWQVFWLLACNSTGIEYVYHRPEGYGEWLSRDPRRPRLVYKMSGISSLGTRTALVVTAGYDIDRVRQLIEFYEPSVVCLALQQDSVDPQNHDIMGRYRAEFSGLDTVQMFEIDAYRNGHGESELAGRVSELCADFNVICASLGPKLSAISLFKLHWGMEDVGLIYLPSNEFNLHYSHGIGDAIEGRLDLTELTPTSGQ